MNLKIKTQIIRCKNAIVTAILFVLNFIKSVVIFSFFRAKPKPELEVIPTEIPKEKPVENWGGIPKFKEGDAVVVIKDVNGNLGRRFNVIEILRNNYYKQIQYHCVIPEGGFQQVFLVDEIENVQ